MGALFRRPEHTAPGTRASGVSGPPGEAEEDPERSLREQEEGFLGTEPRSEEGGTVGEPGVSVCTPTSAGLHSKRCPSSPTHDFFPVQRGYE